jgi:hypothetical protein
VKYRSQGCSRDDHALSNGRITPPGSPWIHATPSMPRDETATTACGLGPSRAVGKGAGFDQTAPSLLVCRRGPGGVDDRLKLTA